jgi:hypothetical protein
VIELVEITVEGLDVLDRPVVSNGLDRLDQPGVSTGSTGGGSTAGGSGSCLTTLAT